MSFRIDTLVAAGILGVFLLAGSVMSAHAGDGKCDKDNEAGTTSTLWSPAASTDAHRL